jgi:hypothetical protein
MQDQIFDGTPIRKLPLGQVLWLLQGLQGMWRIPPDYAEAADQCIERLRIELVIRTMPNPP